VKERTLEIIRNANISWLSVMINGVGAGLIYGTFAYFANAKFGLESSMPAALLQFFLSFLSTFVYVLFLEIVFKDETLSFKRKIMLTLGLEAIYTLTLVLSHYLHGTPNILFTVLPSVVLGGGYMVLYVIWILKHNEIKAWIKNR